MFVDEVTVKLRAGNGGPGCVSFRREKFIPKGGPDGGDGGRGGNVILQCDENVGDLTDFHYKPHWEAENGRPGQGRQKFGRAGKDCIMRLPPGTMVFPVEAEAEDPPEIELLRHGQEHVLLAGGKGGWGNMRFKSSTNQAPRQSGTGEEGGAGEFRLVLKVIADIGLVGYPNAGKSTLTGVLTNASPKTASYPFTTLNPKVGVVHFKEHYGRLTLADIPGLIDGASENRGLGHRFLRHIERCRVLLHIIDLAATDGRDPLDDYQQLRSELAAYDPALTEKPHLVAGNKVDEAAAQEHLERFRKAHAVPVFPISALLEEGLPELKKALWETVQKTAPVIPSEEAESETKEDTLANSRPPDRF